MILDALPQPVRDTLLTAIGFPSVAWTELQARSRPVTTEITTRVGSLRQRAGAAATQLADRLGDVPRPSVDLPSVKLPDLDLPTSVGDVTTAVDTRIKALEARVGDLEARADAVFDKVAGQLPDPAREAVTQAREAAKEARAQLVRTFTPRAA